MSFTVDVAPSGHRFRVEPGETLLEAALSEGLNLPYGCRNGQCGNCIATLESGRVGYPSGRTGALEGRPANACLTCQAVPESDLRLSVHEVEDAAELKVRSFPCKVDRITRLSHDVVQIFLRLPEGQRLQFLAGQYLNFFLPDGRKRAFSIANAPHDDARIELHIRHVPGGEFTDYVFNQLQEKTVLRVEAPLGGYYLREQSQRPIILMGGGTGFAPIKGIIEHAFHIGVRRPMHLFWGVRAEPDLYLPELPRQWAKAHANFRYTPVLSEPGPDWRGERGWVHEAVVDRYPDLSAFEIYMSGPPPMIEAGRSAFIAHQLDLEHLFSDSFDWAKDQPGKAAGA